MSKKTNKKTKKTRNWLLILTDFLAYWAMVSYICRVDSDQTPDIKQTGSFQKVFIFSCPAKKEVKIRPAAGAPKTSLIVFVLKFK